MRPTTRMSTSMERIQSGIAIQTRPRGSPELKESRVTDAVRQDFMAERRLVLGRSGESLTRFMLGPETGRFKAGAEPRTRARPRHRSVAVQGALAGVLVGT